MHKEINISTEKSKYVNNQSHVMLFWCSFNYTCLLIKFSDDVKNEMSELFVLYDGNQNDITKGWDYIFIDVSCSNLMM